MSRLYTLLARPILFRLDPEVAHRTMLRLCACGGRSAWVKSVVRSHLSVVDPRLEQTIAGIHFTNPLGLAAGFDKNGVALPMLGALGFGHLEMGSVSAYSSEGNSRPRLFRVPADESIVVHYGVPNDGASVVAERIQGRSYGVPLGINLVKTNDPRRPPTDDEVQGDYAFAFAKLQELGSYMTLNLSCPNTANDQNYFDEIPKIHALLERLASQTPRVPVFLKLKPISDRGWLRELIATTDQFSFVAGFGINLPAGKPADLQLTVSREALGRLPGAVSGRPVANLINAHLKVLSQVLRPAKRYKLIAAGGVFTAQDAYRKIRLGASLVQVYTALVYRGPGVVREILQGLIQLLERDRFGSVEEAVGADIE